MTNDNLCLIGTSHIGPRGRERLNSMLRNVSPKKIALEMAKRRENPQIIDKIPDAVARMDILPEERGEVSYRLGELTTDMESRMGVKFKRRTIKSTEARGAQ
jgi:pheromone shutdown protein TraB